MRPAHTRPSARLLRLGALLFAALTVVHLPIVAGPRKPDADQHQLELSQESQQSQPNRSQK